MLGWFNPGNLPKVNSLLKIKHMIKQNQLLNEEQFRKAQDEYGGSFRAEMGAEAIKELLKRVDVEELAVSLRV